MADYNLGTVRGRIEIDSSGVNKGVDDADKKVQGFLGGLEKSSGSLLKVGGLLGGVGAAAVAGFGLAINKAADFEKQVSAIGAVTNATGQELDSLRQLALKLGADTKFSAGEAAGAIEELAKAGIPVKDIISGAAAAVTDLAAAGDVDLKRATEITANAMNAFGIQGKDAAHIADVFASAANTSAADVSELGVSLQQVAAVAATVGLSFDDTIAALSLFADKGLKGSDAGTSLKTSLLSLQPTTEKQKDLFKSLGLLTDEGANKLVNMGGKVLSTAELIQRLGGASEAMTKQFAKAGVVVDKTNGTFKDASGHIITVEEAQKRLSTITGISTTKWNSLGLEVSRGGNAFFDASGKLRPLVEIQAALQQATAGMTQQQKLATLEAIGGTDAVRALSIITDTSKDKLLEYGTALGKQGSAQETAKKRMDNLKGSLEQLSGSFETAIIAIGRLGTGPVRSVIDFLTKLVNGFIALPDSAKQFIVIGVLVLGLLTGLAGGFLLAAGGLIKMVKTFQELKKALQIIKEMQLMTKAMEALNLSFLTNPIFLMVVGLIALGTALFIAYKKVKGFHDFVDALWQAIQVAFHAIVGAGEAVVNFFKGHWNQILIAVMPVIGLPLLIIRHWGEIVDFFASLGAKIAGYVGSFFSAAWDLIMGLVDGLVKGFVAVYTFFYVTVPDAIINAFVAAAKWLWNAGTDIIGGLIGAIVAAAEAVWSWFGDLWNAILRIIGDTARWLWDVAWNMITGFLNAVVDGAESLWRFFRDLLGTILRIIGNTERWLWDQAWAMITGFFNSVVAGAEQIWSWFQDLSSRIVGFFADAGSWLWDAGRAIIQGLIDGFQSMIGVLKRGWNGIIDLIPGHFADGLKIGSPSKVMAQLARWIPLGVAKGIEDTLPKIQQAMDRVQSVMVSQGLDPGTLDRALVAHTISIPNSAGTVTNTTNHGDTFHQEFHTEASAADISFEIAWQKRIR